MMQTDQVLARNGPSLAILDPSPWPAGPGDVDVEDKPLSRSDPSKVATIRAPPTGGNSLPIEQEMIIASSRATSSTELWAYYVYYIGSTGLGLFNYSGTQLQNLLSQAGRDIQTSAACSYSSVCVLEFAGSLKTVNSIVLICNGISFAVSAFLFILIGAYADYGRWRPWLLIFFTALSVAISFGWLGVEDPSKWRSAAALYILGVIGIQGALTFYTAAFPSLSRDLAEVRDSLRAVSKGEKILREHEHLESQSRNRIWSYALIVGSLGELVILAIAIGAILKGLGADDGMAQNTEAYSVMIAYAGGVWVVLCSIPWFLLEKHRDGLPLPPGSSYLTVGIKQLYTALRECTRLKDAYLYLYYDDRDSDYPIFMDSIISYSMTQLSYLTLLGIGTQVIGIFSYWLVQRRFSLSTKTMFSFNVFWVIILTGWGLIGIWSSRFGFKNVWEIYIYEAFYGLLITPWYTYSQTMVSEVAPLDFEYMFFALFSIVGKTSAFIGPLVSSAIVDDSNNANMPFAFLFALAVISTGFLYFINLDRSRMDGKAYSSRHSGRPVDTPVVPPVGVGVGGSNSEKAACC